VGCQLSDQKSLFPTPPETSEERAQRIDAMVLNVLCGKTPYSLSEGQRLLLNLLRYRRGIAKAISIGEIGERLRMTPRQIKGDIADLTVRFRLPIGSSRDPSTNGYYFPMTHQECLDSATPHIRQGLAHFRRVQVLLDKHDLNDLLGQYSLDLETGEGDSDDPVAS
jgi:hypothetical protein